MIVLNLFSLIESKPRIKVTKKKTDRGTRKRNTIPAHQQQQYYNNKYEQPEQFYQQAMTSETPQNQYSQYSQYGQYPPKQAVYPPEYNVNQTPQYNQNQNEPDRNLQKEYSPQPDFGLYGSQQSQQPSEPKMQQQMPLNNFSNEDLNDSKRPARATQGADFTSQFNALMQSRVSQLQDQFPWTFRPDDCDLSMELFPMYYVPILRSANLRIQFSSNCLTTRDINFDVTFDDQLFINWIFHPTTVYINLWGNVYRLEFSVPIVIDRFDVMKSLEYTHLTIFNANAAPQLINLNTRNVVYLRPQQIYSFNRNNIRKLRNLNGYFLCQTTSRRLSNWEVYVEQRDTLIRQLRSQGETEDEIIRQVDKIILINYQNENSPTVRPVTFPSAQELLAAGFEFVEETERLRARESAKRTFMREFIEDFEIDCQIM